MGVAETIESILSTIESDIFIGSNNDSISNICTIYPSAGNPPEHCFGTNSPVIRNPTIQVRVRDTSYSLGYTRAEAILTKLSGYSSTGMSIFATSDVLSIGKDDKNRSEFTINFRIILIN